jgi:hypothetical protein
LGGGDSSRITGAERFVRGQKNKDEIIIDSLFADVADKTGFFIKLSKEVLGRPGDWMVMDVIDQDWRKWADIDSEVLDIVRRHTRVSPLAAKKWGSGQYRIEVACKGGMRGQSAIKKDIHINADEETIEQQVGGGSWGGGSSSGSERVDPQVVLSDRIGEMSTMIKTVGELIPKPIPTDPNAIAAAFQQGMALSSNEKNNSSTLMIGMMQTMMTSMMGVVTALIGAGGKKDGPDAMELMRNTIGMMKDMGAIGQQPLPPKSIVEFMQELKAMGLNPFEREDPLAQINKLKQLAEMALKFTGMQQGETERPGWVEKLIEAVGPALPTIVQMVQNSQGGVPQIPPMQQIPVQVNQPIGGGERTTSGSGPVNNPPIQENEQNMNQIRMFLNQVYESAKKNNRDFYKMILTVLSGDANGQAMIEGMATGGMSEVQLIEMLQQYGGDRFKDSEFVMKYLVPYTKGFVLWVRDQAKKEQLAQSGTVDAICNICKQEYEFDSLAHWAEELDKNCTEKNCQGILELIPQQQAV